MENIQTSPGTPGGSVVVTRSISREMVHARTLELASIAGRNSHQIMQVDYEQAKRELTGETDFDRQQAVLDFPEYI
jgi:hypothetical protein